MRSSTLAGSAGLALLLIATPALAGGTEDNGATLAAADRVFSAAAEKAAPSVVQIVVERAARPRTLTAMERARLGLRGFVPQGYYARPQGPVSGVVIAPGLIATSKWNLDGDGAIKVTGPDGTTFKATRVGRDEGLRVSLLRVEDKGGVLKPIERSGAQVRPGRMLLLVGRTDQNQASVTRGIVSGLKRERGAAFTHSCRTSYGNVGGAIVDMHGKLVGISVGHHDRAGQGQSSGVGFGARVERITPNLAAMAKGKVIAAPPRAFLGIGLDRRYSGEGVRVGNVIEGTGAKAAGIAQNDVILVFNSVKIEHFAQLVEEILKLEVGTEIVVTVRRGEEEIDFTVKLGARPKGT